MTGLKFNTLQAALESIGFKPPRKLNPAKNESVDDGDLDDTITEHQMEELDRLRKI